MVATRGFDQERKKLVLIPALARLPCLLPLVFLLSVTCRLVGFFAVSKVAYGWFGPWRLLSRYPSVLFFDHFTLGVAACARLRCGFVLLCSVVISIWTSYFATQLVRILSRVLVVLRFSHFDLVYVGGFRPLRLSLFGLRGPWLGRSLMNGHGIMIRLVVPWILLCFRMLVLGSMRCVKLGALGCLQRPHVLPGAGMLILTAFGVHGLLLSDRFGRLYACFFVLRVLQLGR